MPAFACCKYSADDDDGDDDGGDDGSADNGDACLCLLQVQR